MATVMTTALSLASVVVADAVAVGINVAGAVSGITRATVITDAIAIGIDVTPPSDGLHGRVSRYGSLPRGQVSHAKRKGRHGKNGAQCRGRDRDHFPLH